MSTFDPKHKEKRRGRPQTGDEENTEAECEERQQTLTSTSTTNTNASATEGQTKMISNNDMHASQPEVRNFFLLHTTQTTFHFHLTSFNTFGHLLIKLRSILRCTDNVVRWRVRGSK